MATLTLQLISPQGYPLQLALQPDDDGEKIKILLQRAETLGAWMITSGWSFADAPASQPPASELAAGPTFAGFRCSPTVDARGLPTWILVDGHQAMRREKQGDVWYSAKNPDGTFIQALRIPKGETPPAVQGL